MDILKVIARLMDYPTEGFRQHGEALKECIEEAKEISPPMRSQLAALVDHVYAGDLFDAQEHYGELFDRGRSLSLLLFEHVHGESRDRGQAMVDLMALYEQNGFAINVRELPDYIPLYLEYLAQRPEMEAREGLADVSHILAMLSARLQERKSQYHSLFDALLMVAGVTADMTDLLKTAASEERDDTMEAMDKIWEEEAITFGMDNDQGRCPSATQSRPSPSSKEQPVPMHWVHEASVEGAPTGSNI